MGVHYVKDALVRDGQLDPERPEALLYEMRNGKLFLLAASRPSTHCTSGPGGFRDGSSSRSAPTAPTC
jgi:hypothetical protein